MVSGMRQTDAAAQVRVPVTTLPTPLALASYAAPLPADRQPALVYLARLAPRSRRTIGADLLALARLLGGPTQDLSSLPWHALRYQHTQALRTRLQEQVSPRTGKPLAPVTIN